MDEQNRLLLLNLVCLSHKHRYFWGWNGHVYLYTPLSSPRTDSTFGWANSIIVV